MEANKNHNDDENNDDYFRNLPTGYQFNPTDQEIVVSYLRPMIKNEPVPRNRIVEKDIYQTDPETLTQGHRRIREDGWYFFSRRERKYPNGKRPSRRAGDGKWKATGSSTEILDENNQIIGERQVLDYVPDGENRKSNWKMVEYKLSKGKDESTTLIPKMRNGQEDPMELDHVLYKIYINSRAEGNANNNATIPAENSDEKMIVASQSDTTLVPNNEVAQAQPHDSSSMASNTSLQVPQNHTPNSFFAATNHSNGSISTSNNQVFNASASYATNFEASTSYATNYEASTSYGSNFDDPMWELDSYMQHQDELSNYSFLWEEMPPPPIQSSTSSEIHPPVQPHDYEMPPVDDSRFASVRSSHGNQSNISMDANGKVENVEMHYVHQGDVEENDDPREGEQNDSKAGEDHTKTELVYLHGSFHFK